MLALGICNLLNIFCKLANRLDVSSDMLEVEVVL